MMELKLDLDDLDYIIDSMMLLGSKGTTGTQASFLELFEGDQEKVRAVDRKIAEKWALRNASQYLDRHIQESLIQELLMY